MRRYLTPRCIGLHVTLAVVLPIFAALTDWQYHRAISGNTLSWAYTFEWPLFGGYAIYLWWQLIHDQPDERRAKMAGEGLVEDHDRPGWALERRPARRRRAGRAAVPVLAGGASGVPPAAEAGGPGSGATGEGEPVADREDDVDERMAAYNRYLADLHARGGRKTW